MFRVNRGFYLVLRRLQAHSREIVPAALQPDRAVRSAKLPWATRPTKRNRPRMANGGATLPN